MKVIEVCAECSPMAKVGGHVEVVVSLPKFQQWSGKESMVVMKLYDNDYMKKTSFNISPDRVIAKIIILDLFHSSCRM